VGNRRRVRSVATGNQAKIRAAPALLDACLDACVEAIDPTRGRVRRDPHLVVQRQFVVAPSGVLEEILHDPERSTDDDGSRRRGSRPSASVFLSAAARTRRSRRTGEP
jgi:hypothetical protein